MRFTLGVVLLLLIGKTYAQHFPTMIVLDKQTFSQKRYGELQQLASQVAAMVDELIPGRMSELVRGDIVCFQTTQGQLDGMNPQFHPPLTISTDFKLPYEPAATIVGRTRIALFEVEPPQAVTYRERFVYQLAHELAHVKMGVRIDNYLIETLATAVSHEVLIRLGMLAYANLEFNEQLHKLPYDTQLAYSEKEFAILQQYWQSQITQQTGIENRPFQTLGAALIRLNTVPWPAFLGVALDTDCPLNNPPLNMRVCAPNLQAMKAIDPVLSSLGYPVQ